MTFLMPVAEPRFSPLNTTVTHTAYDRANACLYTSFCTYLLSCTKQEPMPMTNVKVGTRPEMGVGHINIVHLDVQRIWHYYIHLCKSWRFPDFIH